MTITEDLKKTSKIKLLLKQKLSMNKMRYYWINSEKERNATETTRGTKKTNGRILK